MKREIFTSMLQWVETEMKSGEHTEEEMLFIDAIIEFAVDGITRIKSDTNER